MYLPNYVHVVKISDNFNNFNKKDERMFPEIIVHSSKIQWGELVFGCSPFLLKEPK